MNRTAPETGAVVTHGTRRPGGNWFPDLLARIVRRSERKSARVAQAHRVALRAARNGDPLDRLRRAGLI